MGLKHHCESSKTVTNFHIKVIPNYELESLILSFGEKIKILSPDSLQKRVKNRLLDKVKNYNE